MYDQAEAIAEKIGNKNAQEVNLHDIGIIVHDQGEYLAAKKIIEASLAIDRDTGYKVGIEQNLTSLGNIASDLGDMSGSCLLYTSRCV